MEARTTYQLIPSCKNEIPGFRRTANLIKVLIKAFYKRNGEGVPSPFRLLGLFNDLVNCNLHRI